MPYIIRSDKHPTQPGYIIRSSFFVAVVGPSISSVSGTYAPGQQLVISTENLGTITSVTLGGEALTIDATDTDEVTATIPDWIEIAAGATVSLVVGDGTDTANLDDIVFVVRSTATAVNYVEPAPLLDEAETESFRELARLEYGYTLQTGDQIQHLTIAGFTVAPDSSFELTNTTQPDSSFAIFRAATQDWLTGPNSPTDYWLPFSIQQPDATPDALAFTPATDIALNGFAISNEVTLTGFNEQLTISITNGTYSINGGTFTSATGVIDLGDTLVLRAQASANYESEVVCVVTTGAVQHNFSITTIDAPQDTTPDAFSFTAQADVEPNTVYESNVITVTGITAAAPITIDGTGRYRISTDGGTTWSAYTSSAGTVNNNDQVQLDNTSSVAFSTGITTTLTIGGVPGGFTLTTRASDTTPNPFSFTDVANAALGQMITSDTVTITGITDPASISVSGGAEYSINSGAWISAATTISNGQNVRVRIVSSALNSTAVNATLTIGGVSDTFTVTTESLQDTTPNGFTFPPITNAALSASVESAAVVISGINAPSDVTITNGEYQIGANAWTSLPGTISNGQQIRVRQDSSSAGQTETIAVLNIGGVSANFSVTTRAADTTPDAFSFTDVVDAELSLPYESNIVTITGIDGPASVSATAGAEISINGAAYTSTPGDILNNQTVRVRVTSSAINSTPVNATVTIGGVSAVFSVVTESAIDQTPAQFTFAPVANADTDVLYTSAPTTITDINAPTALTIAGTGAEYSIDGGLWSNVATTVTNNQEVRVRIRSSVNAGTSVTAALTVGGVSASYQVTTLGDLSDGSINESIDVLVFTYPAANDGRRNVLYRNNTNHVVMREIIYEYSLEPVNIQSITFQLQDIASNVLHGPLSVQLDGHYRISVPHTLNLDAYEQVKVIIDIDSTDGSQALLSITHDVEDRNE
jgi:hypothetical protein